jgi:UDP-N-acetyl-D-mannosaminuronate dehydrogenase
MRSLTIGAGEIGKSLHAVLSEKHESYIRDIEDLKVENIDVLNICYPPFKGFVAQTKRYIAQYKPRLTIIHSTVAPGTTKKCGAMVVHSPVHGKHPNLQGGIKTFVKYIGGEDVYAVYLADKFLREAGIKTQVVSSSKTSELSKILCTTYYGWNILFMKEVAEICRKEGVPFHEVYTEWNFLYNTGYSELGMKQFSRPILDPVPGKIGGHCVVNNCDLLDSFVTRTIKEKNKNYEK